MAGGLLKVRQENPFERTDVRGELDDVERELEALRLQFEQFFSGRLLLLPEKLHANIKRRLRKLSRSPLKNSEMSFKLKTLEARYHALNSYWQRVLRAREDGTYTKDVFKANMRERFRQEDRLSQTVEGGAERAMKHLFTSYQHAMEKQTGKAQNLDYAAFQRAIIQRTREFKERNQGQRVSFKVVLQGGKVTIKASVKAVK